MTRAELVEAMARAICAEDAECGPWDMAPRILRQALRDEATAALAAIEAAGFAVTPRGLWETLHNGLNCVIHEEDNDPPDMANAVRIARATLDEARAMIAASPVEARDE